MSGREVYPTRTTGAISIITKADMQVNTDFMLRVAKLLMNFDMNNTKPEYNHHEMLRKMAEALEEATNLFIKNDPDPLDDRHPHRTHPESALGNILKLIFKNDDFMTKLVVSYILARDDVELNIQGCRVLLACIPGLDSKVVFSEPDDFIPRLYTWAQDNSNETLQGYAMGLLAGALENAENTSKYRNDNIVLVPFALDRLRVLQARIGEEPKEEPKTDFSQLAKNSEGAGASNGVSIPTVQVTEAKEEATGKHEDPRAACSSSQPPPKKRKTEPCLSNLLRTETAPRVPSYQNLRNLDDSNSKWDILQPFLIGAQQVYPLSLATYQRYILQYLAACGEYQDLLFQVFEGNALDLLLDYIDLEKSKDVRLTFDALKYLTSLLVHRKFALEFIEKDGLKCLLRLPRTSLASVGVVTCLYYIAYSLDVMEQICLMDDETVDETVQYVLWCLEHSHESGMSSACMFFSQALFYKAILKRFDQFDGPRKLYNYISTLTIMQSDEHVDLTEEQVHTSTQCVRSVCITTRSYLTAHVFVRCEQYKKQFGPVLPSGMTVPEQIQIDMPESKTMKNWEETAWECEMILLEMIRLTNGTFKEAENLRKLGMIRMFLAVRIISREWTSVGIHLRNEMCVHALDSLSMLLCQPSIQIDLLAEHTFHTTTVLDGLCILLETSQGHHDEDPPLRQSALGCVQKCVCVNAESWKTLEHLIKTGRADLTVPPPRRSQLVQQIQQAGAKKTPTIMSHLERMWNAVRSRDGIILITKLIFNRVPITDADQMRKLATNTMAGLARHPEVRQILSKLPLIAQMQLQFLMREPVCSDKRVIHAAFCKEAIQLLQIVTGKKMHLHQKDIPVHGLTERHNHDWIMENTKVKYNETELLQVIHDHLSKLGLSTTASALKLEANLPDVPASRTTETPVRTRPFPSLGNNFTKIEDTYPTLAPRTLESEIGGISGRRPSQLSSPMASRSMSHEEEVFATPTLPRRFTNSGSGFPRKLTISPRVKPRPSSAGDSRGGAQPCNDLNSIVIDHFKNQHSKCKNPVTTCPPFSLYFPHKCPERMQKTTSIPNMAKRIYDADLLRPNQRIVAQWNNERNIFSKFKSLKTVHDHDESYTQATFSVDDEHLIVGFFNGELHWQNVDTGADEGHTNCHGSAITNIEQSKDGSLILTSSAYVRPLSALWRLGEAMTRVHVYKEDTCVRFANTTQQRIIGTNGTKALVYDTETNIVVDQYSTKTGLGLRYTRNFATFSPDDKLIFNDGLLWDVREKKRHIHLFDRLNPKTQFGSFHPHGTQIIINTEVYDLRNYAVLHHVPELDKCQLRYNSTGNIMYASETSDLSREHFPDQVYASFRSFDTSDYTTLTTFEGRRPVLDLCSSHHDQKLVVIEQLRPMMSDYMVQASTQIRFLEAGRWKEQDDEQEEEDEDDQQQEREREMVSDNSSEDEREMVPENLSPQSMDVFEALGRLDDDGRSIASSDGSDTEFRQVLDELYRGSRGRPRRRPVLHVNIDENGQVERAEEIEVEDEQNDEEEELSGEESVEPENADEDSDDDFDMQSAIDALVDGVDDEIDEDELGSSDGSWRTVSRVGSDDINLDDLDEEAAREAQNEGDDELEMDPPFEPEPAVSPNPPRRHRHRRHHRRRGAVPLRDQRAQLMGAAMERREEAMQQQQDQPPDPDAQAEYESESEEEINSVSTIALNPALRRRRRLQD